MTRIYKIKNVPFTIQKVYQKKYPNCTYNFYTYKRDNTLPMQGDNKVYGCEVLKDGKLYSNALQGTLLELTKLL